MNIRKQTYSLEQYLKLMGKEVIREDQECQRLSGQWNANMVGELIATVLTNNYIPPIILGEEIKNDITRQWIIDGVQRSSSLFMFRYMNGKISRSIEEYLISYQCKVVGEDGVIQRDKDGEIIWQTAQCDIRNKTYKQLPPELKDRFNEYQIETAIHQNCDVTEISKLVRKYNNHRAMNLSQKAFTYLDAFAVEVRSLANSRFFKDLYKGSSKDRTNGVTESIVGDMVLLCNYPDKYHKNMIQGFRWLNENATICDFNELGKLLDKMTDSVIDIPGACNIFNRKNSPVFTATYKRLADGGMDGIQFRDFIQWFIGNGHTEMIDGKTWDELDAKTGTRDTTLINAKLNHLLTLARQFATENKKAA